MASFLQFCSETTPLPLAGPLTSFEQCFTLILELKRVQVMEKVFDLLSGLINGVMIFNIYSVVQDF